MSTFTIERTVNAPKDVVWSVISDVVGYADIAPNLSKAGILSGEGKGMQRQCRDTNGGIWQEQCVLRDEGHRYSMLVDTSDYPYPFSSMQGTWGLEENAEGVQVSMQFDYIPKYGPIGWLMDKVYIKPAFQRICEKLMGNWEVEIMAKAQEMHKGS